MSPEAKPNQNLSGSSCWDCEQDPAGKLRQMFVDIVQSRRIKLGQRPALRPVFLKPHGVAHGTFEMRKDLPADQKIGVFAMERLTAWVRFSSHICRSWPVPPLLC